MKYCPKCKIELPDAAKFCKSCGGALTDKVGVEVAGLRCPSCGAEVQAGWKFCKKCAARLEAAPPAAPVFVKVACPHCGTSCREGTKFCKSCGKPLGTVDASAATVSAMDAVAAPRAASLTTAAASAAESAGPKLGATGAAPQPTLAGSRLSRVVCPKCGAHMAAGLKFCEKCGAALARMERRPSAAPTPTQAPSGAKTALIAGGIAAVVLVAAGAGWYFWGVHLTVTSDPGGAQVYLDGQAIGTTGDADGLLKIPHVHRGHHTLSAKREGFQEWLQPVELGITDFSLTFKGTLKPQSFSLTVLSLPPASRVYLDAQDMGVTDENEGKLVLQDVSRGRHVLMVRHEGLPDAQQEITVESSSAMRVELGGAPASLEQRGVADHLARASSLFQNRQYQAAIAECDEALKLDPGNRAASNLKSQIQRTMEILGIQHTQERKHRTNSAARSLSRDTGEGNVPSQRGGKQFPLGTWSGTVTHESFWSYPVVVKLDGSGGGRADYEILHCGASLTLVTRKSNKYVFTENFDYGKENCIAGLSLVLEVRADGVLSYKSFHPGGLQAGSGTLQRIDR